MKFRKKPVVVEAMRYTPQTGDNWREIVEWVGDNAIHAPGNKPIEDAIMIKTLEGDMRADVGDWIIKGVKGEFYPCKHDVFIATYETAE